MTNNLPIRTALALTLVISAISATATAASARYDQESSPPAQSQTANPRPEVHSNPDQQAPQTGKAGTPPILRRATPSERATITQAQQPERQAQAEVARQLAYAKVSSAETNAYANLDRTNVTAPTGGFDWGDAGIGVAAGIVLSLLGLAGVLMVSRRRPDHSRGSATATS